MKTAISIPDNLFAAGERFARELGLSRSELHRRALASCLENRQARLVTERLNTVYAAQPSSLDPGLALLQDATIPGEEW